eukprot:gene14779-19861_t
MLKSAEFNNFTVGQRVRVFPHTIKDNNSDNIDSNPMIGLISYIHDNGIVNAQDFSYDILFDNNKELCNISHQQIHALFDFEYEIGDITKYNNTNNTTTTTTTNFNCDKNNNTQVQNNQSILQQQISENIKEYGNKLFMVKDYSQSLLYYKRALELLLQQKSHAESLKNETSFFIGSYVLVSTPKSLEFKIGMISDQNDNMYDVIYDNSNNDEDENDEENNISSDRLYLLTYGSEGRSLQRSLYMNMAKCCLKKNQTGWSIRYASMALALLLSLSHAEDYSDVKSSKKQLGDAYYFRAKALITANRPQLAMKDMIQLIRYDQPRADTLEKEIKSYRLKQQKTNRKLAKDIANWIDTAMTMSSQHQKSSTQSDHMNDHDTGLDDIDIEIMDDQQGDNNHYYDNNNQSKIIEQKADSKYDAKNTDHHYKDDCEK